MATTPKQDDSREQLIVEALVERFLNDPEVSKYVNEKVMEFCSPWFDANEPMTEQAQERVCQYQLTVYHRIFAKAIANVLYLLEEVECHKSRF